MKISDSCAKNINNICTNFKIYHIKNNFNIEISERILKNWIKEEYYKDTIKRSFKKLVKIK